MAFGVLGWESVDCESLFFNSEIWRFGGFGKIWEREKSEYGDRKGDDSINDENLGYLASSYLEVDNIVGLTHLHPGRPAWPSIVL